ncbi:MAG: MnhB domain-containing protein [Pseudomonadota bacterium]
MLEEILIYFTIFSSFLCVLFFIRSNNLLVLTILNSAFSLFTCVMYLLLDAPDVAMTEAVVGVLVTIFTIFTIKKAYKNNYVFDENLNLIMLTLTILLAGYLIYSSFDLSVFGAPIFDHYYLNNTGKEIEIPSVVAAILASYRGYDTLYETLVITIAGIGVLLVSDISNQQQSETSDILSKVITRFIFPILIIFAFYILFHGEISPGGGFQAGAILAASIIIHSMLYEIYCSSSYLLRASIFGVLIYFLVGIIGIFSGLEFLNYSILGQKTSILIAEIGIAIAVASTMCLIYLGIANATSKSEL